MDITSIFGNSIEKSKDLLIGLAVDLIVGIMAKKVTSGDIKAVGVKLGKEITVKATEVIGPSWNKIENPIQELLLNPFIDGVKEGLDSDDTAQAV